MIGLRAGARPWLGLGRGGLGLEAVQRSRVVVVCT